MGFRDRARAEESLLAQAKKVLRQIREANDELRETAAYNRAVSDKLRDAAIRRTQEDDHDDE